MTFEQFSQGTSILHRLDARMKLISAALLTLVLALTGDARAICIGLILGTVLATLTGIGLKPILMRLLVVNSFTIFLWCTLPLTYPGEQMFQLGPLSLSMEGIRLAGLITLKTNAIVLICISLLATSAVADLGHALSKLRFPQKFCLLLLFSYRYIFVIHQEFIRLTRAAKLRNFSPGTNMHTYRTFGYLFGMTLVKSWHRADRVNRAMALRGFDGKFYSLNDTSLSMTDMIFTVTMVLVSGVLATMDFWPAINLI